MTTKRRRYVFTGGRRFADADFVSKVFDDFDPGEVFFGDATGLDSIVRDICRERGIECQVFAADWRTYGASAGPRRNRVMIEHAGPDAALLAFPGGKGTADCTRQAFRMRLTVYRLSNGSLQRPEP